MEVLITESIGKFLFDQLTPREIATVIVNQIVFCNISKRRRKYDIAGIFLLIRHFTDDEPVDLIPPVDCLLEGGDIMVNKGRVISVLYTSVYPGIILFLNYPNYYSGISSRFSAYASVARFSSPPTRMMKLLIKSHISIMTTADSDPYISLKFPNLLT